MYHGLTLKRPIFEIGLKGYLHGQAAVQLAREADRICRATGVTVIYDPQCVDIPAVARETNDILVFAQHMDAVTVGRGAGAVLPEAIKEAGAVGVMLNHCERPLTLAQISQTIQRADEVGLATMVCADSPQEAAAIAQLAPNIILAEPPALIGSSGDVMDQMRPFVRDTLQWVKQINPDIAVMCSAGIKTAEDVSAMMALGVDATGSSSGILKAPDPVAVMEAMIHAMRDSIS